MTERPDLSAGQRGDEAPPPDPEPHQPDTAADVDPDVAQLLGLRPAGSESIPTADELDTMGEITSTRIYQGDLEARPPDSDQPDEGQAENLESLLAAELRDGETDDPNEAAEEGLTWVPPVDPPVRTDERGDVAVAAGFGTTAQDEPFDADHHDAALSTRDEVVDRVIEALRADAATSGFADSLAIDAVGGIIRVDGRVQDLDDEDAVLGVIEDVSGVTSVESRLVVTAVEEAGARDPR